MMSSAARRDADEGRKSWSSDAQWPRTHTKTDSGGDDEAREIWITDVPPSGNPSTYTAVFLLFVEI